jgi:hypothetical protein
MMIIGSLAGIVAVALLAAAAPAAAQDLAVYTDGLQNGFQNFSFGGGSDFANPDPTHGGNASISFTGNDTFNAVSFARPGAPLTTASFPRLRFFVRGGAPGGQQLRVILQVIPQPNDPSVEVASGELDAYIQGGVIQADAWTEVVVRFADPPLSFAGEFHRIDLQTDTPGGAQPVLFIDDVTLLAADGPAPPANPLLIERGVAVDQGFGPMVSDRFTWRDAANQPRVAVLAHNDGQGGPGGTRGGELRELRYETPAGTRVVRASGSGASGFGYVVSHRSEGGAGINADDSPLGHGFPGQIQRVFEGRHHAIFRFTQLYPRFATVAAGSTRFDVPVTMDWLFATGRDHPLWAVTWDLSGVPVNAVESDSRAPYGELLFDGAATEGAHSVIAGVGWGDRFKFATTTAPVTYNSQWTWNTPNTVPYAKLWTTAVDATMGTVQTQTIVQQDAGGYFGTSRWGTTSAGGVACAAGEEGPGLPAHLMPCSFNWPYQLINFSIGAVIGLDDNTPTNNTRLAWGTNFGFLGQAQYPIHGTALFGGPLAGNPRASGHPKKSYSTFVVLGRHSADPVGVQVAQIEAVQTTVLTAAIGSVATAGPAGINRDDPVTYVPAGWNHVYAAWAVGAAANRVDANFNVGAGTLANPLVIVSGWASVALPGAVRLNGVALAQDVDYFPSLRAGAQELWITVNRTLAGGVNRLQIEPAPELPPGHVSLSVTRIGTGSGTVTSAPPGIDCGVTCAAAYPAGTVVTLLPVGVAGAVFVAFGGDPDCADGSVTLTGGVTCTVEFSAQGLPPGFMTLSVTRIGTGGGTVTSAPSGIDCGVTCAAAYPAGTSVTLLPLAAAGSAVVAFGGDPDCADGVVTLTSGIACTVEFSRRVLTVSPPSGTYLTTQRFDLVLIETPGALAVVGRRAALDGVDMTAALGACRVAGALAGGAGTTSRCAGLSGGLLGVGSHTVSVTLDLADGSTATESVTWVVPAQAGPPILAISPPSGAYLTTQGFDLVLRIGAGAPPIVGGTATFDGADVTTALAGCVVPEALPAGGLALRCAGLTGAFLGAGSHVLAVALDFAGGARATATVAWQVHASTEP